ncbi:MAG: hypothetical protein GTN74_09195 [Proteobacteria bacterium]|nr:hypothetical protein [Pseudomonadota bacterium]NIS70134.1 hypothetical protein [Pseudomonadota bacterium]
MRHKPIRRSLFGQIENSAKARGKPAAFTTIGIVFLFATLSFIQCSGPIRDIEAQVEGSEGTMKDSSFGDTERSKGNPKLGSSLSQLLEAYHKDGMTGARAFAERHTMTFDYSRVQVTIVTTEEAIDDVRKTVEAVGGEHQLHYKNLLQAMVPLDALESLVQRPDVLFVRGPRRAVTQ